MDNREWADPPGDIGGGSEDVVDEGQQAAPQREDVADEGRQAASARATARPWFEHATNCLAILTVRDSRADGTVLEMRSAVVAADGRTLTNALVTLALQDEEELVRLRDHLSLVIGVRQMRRSRGSQA